MGGRPENAEAKLRLCCIEDAIRVRGSFRVLHLYRICGEMPLTPNLSPQERGEAAILPRDVCVQQRVRVDDSGKACGPVIERSARRGARHVKIILHADDAASKE
jgi:hypothetical protein